MFYHILLSLTRLNIRSPKSSSLCDVSAYFYRRVVADTETRIAIPRNNSSLKPPLKGGSSLMGLKLIVLMLSTPYVHVCAAYIARKFG